MTNPPALPDDILDEIFHQIVRDGDLASVQRYRLVNKTLAELGGKHIFRAIDLRQRDMYESHPMGTFLELVRGSAVVGYIRVLQVISAEDYDDPGPFELLHLVKNVEFFSIAFGHRLYEYDRIWYTLAPGIRSAIAVFLRSNPLTSLVIGGIHCIPASCLRHLPLLRNLQLTGVSLSGDDDDDGSEEESEAEMASEPMSPHSLSMLVLREGALHVLEYPESLFDISELEALEIDAEEARDADIQQCIKDMFALPSQLKSLDVCATLDGGGYRTWRSCSDMLDSLLPSSLRTLKSISLKFHVMCAPRCDPYAGLLSVLTRIQGSNNCLEDVSLLFHSGYGTSLSEDPAAWHEIDRVLSSGFPSLNSLNLEYILTDLDEDDMVMVFMATQFPWCRGGNLEFQIRTRVRA